MASDAALPPRDPGVAAWEEAADRDWQARRMEVYAAMVTAMDRAVARVIGELEKAAALDDTVILFLSDNGACAEELRGVYALAPLFVRHPKQTADGHPVRFGDRPEIVPGPADTYSTYGRSWAHLSNTPLRSYKHWTYEGGITVPFFVHWPAQLASRAGAIVATPAHMVDVVPTLEQIVAAGSSSPPEVSRAGAAAVAARAWFRSCAAKRSRRARSTGSTKATARSPTATGSWCRAGRSDGSSTTWRAIASKR